MMSLIERTTVAASAFGVALLLLQPGAIAGKPVYVGVAKTSTVPLSSLDHGDWNELLVKYVNENGLVDYEAWHASQTDRQKLRGYLSTLSSASLNDPKAVSANKLAFWINAYNAVTVEGILREYPTSSIRNHTAKLWGYNIWKDLKLYVAGKPYSLDAIEHEVLRKMAEPRIHFAIVCASIGCPRLLNEAYVPERVDEQLTINAKDFFKRSQNFRYDTRANRFYLSSILDWFGEDFGDSRTSVLRRIKPWLPTDATKAAAQKGTASVSYLDYNWNLNEQN